MSEIEISGGRGGGGRGLGGGGGRRCLVIYRLKQITHRTRTANRYTKYGWNEKDIKYVQKSWGKKERKEGKEIPKCK